MDNTITNEEVKNALAILKKEGLRPNKTTLIDALAWLEHQRQVNAKDKAEAERESLKEEADLLAIKHLRKLFKGKDTDEELLNKLQPRGWAYTHSYETSFSITDGECPELDEARDKYRLFDIPRVTSAKEIKKYLQYELSSNKSGVEALLSNAAVKAALEDLRRQIFEPGKLIEAGE